MVAYTINYTLSGSTQTSYIPASFWLTSKEEGIYFTVRNIRVRRYDLILFSVMDTYEGAVVNAVLRRGRIIYGTLTIIVLLL